jgi:hypothetical protein
MKASCPNKASVEWKTLVDKVGEYEAMRDYLEYGEVIRTADEVAYKLYKETGIYQEARLEYEANPELKAIGTIEDYNEYYRIMYPYDSFADFVKQKRKDDHNTVPVSLETLMVDNNDIDLLYASANQSKMDLGTELADKLTKALNIDYELISQDQAAEITKDSKNPYAGEAAFFYNNKVYFIKERINSDTVFHEFSHPFIRGIRYSNPALFTALYDQLASTKEGAELIAQVTEQYPELDEAMLKEEILVQALAKYSIDFFGKSNSEYPFVQFINELLYQIKQYFRKNFGKTIDIAKLSTNTTMQELAKMLSTGDVIKIETELFTEDDIVAYQKNINQAIAEDLNVVKQEQLLTEINTFYDAISTHVNQLKKNKNFKALSDILIDRYDKPELDAMQSNLKAWQSSVISSAEELEDDIKNSKNRTLALSNTILRLERVMRKTLLHVQDIAKQPDIISNAQQIDYYGKFLDQWYTFIKNFDQTLRENNVDSRSTIMSTVNAIRSDIEASQEVIKKANANIARDAVYEQMAPIAKNLEAIYNKRLEELIAKNAPQSYIDEVYQEYHGMTKAEYDMFITLSNSKQLSLSQTEKLRDLTFKSKKGVSITKEKIEQLLKGGLGDANFFNSYLEGYLYNTDPVIGGLALYVKNGLSQVNALAQEKYNVFADDISQDLKDLGITGNAITSLGDKVLFKDNIGWYNPETGVVEKKEILTFLNEYKDYRYDEAVKLKAIEQAELKYRNEGSDVNFKEWTALTKEYNEWRKTYFNQKFVDSFYEKDSILTAEDLAARNQIFEDMRLIQESKHDDDDVSERMNQLWRTYRQMHSLYNIDGTKKDGDELASAKRLREYRDKSREFYEFKIRKGAFETAYFEYAETLADLTEEERKQKLEDWKKQHSRISIRQTEYNDRGQVTHKGYYDTRNEIISQIKAITSKLPSAARSELDKTEKWETILDLIAGYKDEDGQIKGNELHQEAVKKIKSLQEELEQLALLTPGIKGLNKLEAKELATLFNIKEQRLLTPEESKTMAMLLAKQASAKKIINEYDLAKLKSLYKQLADLSNKEQTDYYFDVMNNWVSTLKLSKTTIRSLLNKSTLDKTNITTWLQPDNMDMYFKQNPEFEIWFKANHILKEVYDAGQVAKHWMPLHIWNITKPEDPLMYERFEIKNDAGVVVDTLDGLPSLDYYTRVVKNKYYQIKTVGKNVDNQGNFLPKSATEMNKNTTLTDTEKYKYINSEYQTLQEKDPKLFNLLEKLKKHHLANQEGVSRSNKLYLDAPRFEKERIEILQDVSLQNEITEKWGLFTAFIRRVKAFYQKSVYNTIDSTTNYEDTDNLRNFTLVSTDVFDNELTNIPVAGLYNLNVDDVSRNITYSMMRYMYSVERQKQLVQMSPIAQAIKKTVDNNPIEEEKKRNKNLFLGRGITKFLHKNENIRAKAVSNFIEREFQGKSQAGFTKDIPFLNNLSRAMFKVSSFSFFALNIPSALKNSLSFKFQSIIEGVAGEHFTLKDLHRANNKAHLAMAELSFTGELYSTKSKSLNMQMINVFDMVQGKATDNFGNTMSRTMTKDIVSMSWLYSPRKYVEMQATLQLSYGLLYNTKVNQTQEDGSVKEIDYVDAFEVVDGVLTLKQGVDVRYAPTATRHGVQPNDTIATIAHKYNTSEETIKTALAGRKVSDILDKVLGYEKERSEELNAHRVPNYDTPTQQQLHEIELVNQQRQAINKKYDSMIKDLDIVIDNTEFKLTKNKMHQVANDMAGAYARFDQPEAGRYLLFRYISFLRRYFTTMAMKRFGYTGNLKNAAPRLNPGLGGAQMGFYIEFLKFAKKTILEMGRNLPYMTAAEKRASLRFATEVVMLVIMAMLPYLVFGFDDEDEDRYAKLKQLSGPMGLLGLVSDDPNREFDVLGYSQLHLLNMVKQVHAENNQFNVIPGIGGGLSGYTQLLDLKSIALTPTIGSLNQIIDDIVKLVDDDPKAYYSRDMGPYDWQEQGDAKLMNHAAKVFGLNGASLDPAQAIQNFDSFQTRVRR